MRTIAEQNTITRVLKAWGLGGLDDAESVHRMAYLVQDHDHFGELLRACEPGLRREMYEAMSPYLRFPAKPLEDYNIAAKEHAAAAEFPLLHTNGTLQPYMTPSIQSGGVNFPNVTMRVRCVHCAQEAYFRGDRKIDAIQQLREAGWSYDEIAGTSLCAECLDALDTQSRQVPAE